MRKTVVLLVSLLFLCSLSTLSFAQKAQGKTAKKAESNVEIIRGKIISIDAVNNAILIRDEKTGTERTISASPQMISSLKTDEEVKIKVKLGTSTAESIKKIIRKKTTAKKHKK